MWVVFFGGFFVSGLQFHVQKKKKTAKVKREAKEPKGSAFKINS